MLYIFIIVVFGLGILPASVAIFFGIYDSKPRVALRELKKSQFASILAGMPKNYIATPISKKSLTPAKDADSKLELADPLTVKFDSVELATLPVPASLTGALRRKAANLVQVMQKAGQYNLSVEDKHNLGVILEQFVTSTRLFEGLPETRKDSTLRDQLWNQWNTLELAAEDIHVRTIEGSVKQLSVGSLFVESKFGNKLQLTKKQGK